MKSNSRVAAWTFLAFAYVATVGSTATAATLWTSNVGSDSTSCGASAPCRSISQAIANATAGDTIWVGPGHYGDVNGDNFTGPGDEQPDPNAGMNQGLSGDWGCIVCITKALHIYSTEGAALTVIEGNGSATNSHSTVMISSDGGDFGAVNHGFTITGGNTHGVTIAPGFDPYIGLARNMTVKGNIDIGDGDGFYVFGISLTPYEQAGCPPGYCQFSARILVANNRAISNATGFNIVLNSLRGSGQIIVRDNEALGDTTGFFVYPGYQTEEGQELSAGNIQLVNNIATHGGTGFYADEPGPITYNTALDNSESGFTVTPGGGPFEFNTAIGNGGPGVIVNLSPDPFTVSAGAFSSFSDNNFLGNDRKRGALLLAYGLYLNIDPGPSAHCGVLNLGPLAALYGPAEVTPVPATQLQAQNNYWGSTAGPSSSGPGDNAGGVCDQNISTTVAKPFSRMIWQSTATPAVLQN